MEQSLQMGVLVVRAVVPDGSVRIATRSAPVALEIAVMD
jgi:hypothetical protein